MLLSSLPAPPPRPDLVMVTDLLPLSWQTWLPSGAGGPWGEALEAGLRPLLAAAGGAWAGWSGTPDPLVRPEWVCHDGIQYIHVPLTLVDVEEHLRGHADSTLWPIYHDVIDRPVFHRPWERACRRVTRRYALAVAAKAGTDATVWIQGHRLQLLPGMLRRLRPDLRIGFFLHTPFPPPELFARLPMRADILSGLLGADLIGLHRVGGARNLIKPCEQVLGVPAGDNGVKVRGRPIQVCPFRAGIDAAEVERLAGLESIRSRAAAIRAQLGQPRTLLLGIDDLDASQGTEQRLAAFDALIRGGHLDSAEAVLVQVVLPHPEPTAARTALRERVEREIGRINGDHAKVGGPVVHYLFQPHDLPERVALYLAADVLTVTALREGTSLVAKEYVAARGDGAGAVVLSESTGAAADLPDAYLVNPYDLDAVRATILGAIHATAQDQAARLRRMRHSVHHHDVHVWAAEFLARLGARTGTMLETAR